MLVPLEIDRIGANESVTAEPTEFAVSRLNRPVAVLRDEDVQRAAAADPARANIPIQKRIAARDGGVIRGGVVASTDARHERGFLPRIFAPKRRKPGPAFKILARGAWAV